MIFPRFIRATAGTFILAVLFFGRTDAGELQLAWHTNATGHAVSLAGLDSTTLARLATNPPPLATWQKILPVYASSSLHPWDLLELPPMLGTYQLETNRITFTPQFPLQPGLEYLALFQPRNLDLPTSAARTARLKLPVPVLAPTTFVSTIYPTASDLPENLLKFYVQFSQPMSGGGIYEHIELLNEKNEPVELPFLEIDEELWNPEMTRLTLFIDPGRIKRGVKPLEDIGPALEVGRTFTLRINSAWLDAAGAPLKQPYAKQFKVSTPDRTSPDHLRWQITPPSAGTRQPLVVDFGESLDYALSLRLLRIVDSRGQRVSGTAELLHREQSWRFMPDQPWAAGQFQLQFENILEDLAGNRIGKPFEVDLFEGVQRKLTRITLTREFSIR